MNEKTKALEKKMVPGKLLRGRETKIHLDAYGSIFLRINKMTLLIVIRQY